MNRGKQDTNCKLESELKLSETLKDVRKLGPQISEERIFAGESVACRNAQG